MERELLSNLREVLLTKKVTFVCMGNSCRSPMAEGLLKHVLQQAPEPLRSVQVISCGLDTEEGKGAHSDAIVAMNEKGIDIARHVRRCVSKDIMADSLAIFAMHCGHIERLEARYPAEMPADAYLMRELMPQPNGGVFDPCNAGIGAYRTCRDYMAEAIPSIVTFLSLKIISVLPDGNTGVLKDFSRAVYGMGKWRMT
ncbi:MAG: hypothetical protein LBK07_07425 [Tannerella sp.]|jgi:protein-tyrosine-phosphatase|nr:hypothetical protein [Tannerella sp.]